MSTYMHFSKRNLIFLFYFHNQNYLYIKFSNKIIKILYINIYFPSAFDLDLNSNYILLTFKESLLYIYYFLYTSITFIVKNLSFILCVYVFLIIILILKDS